MYIRHARRKLRNDDGPTEQLGPVEEFIEIEPGKYWPVAWIKSTPPLLAGQLVWPCYACGNPAEGNYKHWYFSSQQWLEVCDACHNGKPESEATQ